MFYTKIAILTIRQTALFLILPGNMLNARTPFMAKIHKTNAARILDSAKVEYELVPYTVDENNLAAGHIAEELGEDINQVFKTLVLKGDKTGHLVCVIPGNCEVDLKKAAKVSTARLITSTSTSTKKPYTT